MTANAPRNELIDVADNRIVTGTRGKLTIMGKRFGVEVLDVGEHALRVSFPFADWPTEGLRVDLDFPADSGFARYRGTVAYEPETAYVAGLVLHDLERLEPDTCLRGNFRVPTDLTVQVKEFPHPRRFDASVLNLSTGGALLRTELDPDSGHRLDVSLSLPSRGLESVPAIVVHSAPDDERPDVHLVGIQFQNARGDAESAISEYIEHRLHAVS